MLHLLGPKVKVLNLASAYRSLVSLANKGGKQRGCVQFSAWAPLALPVLGCELTSPVGAGRKVDMGPRKTVRRVRKAGHPPEQQPTLPVPHGPPEGATG